MKITKFAAVSALTLALASPAVAQMATDGWDADGDGNIANTEFGTGFGENTFSNYDGNADGMLDETEWNTGFGEKAEMWGERAYEMGDFGSYDSNADGMLDQTEYSEGWFNTYDADGSGMIEEPELGDVGDDMGDGGLFDI